MSAPDHVSLGIIVIGRRRFSANRLTLLSGLGGMAHAQSLKSDPRDAAKWTFSSDSSVVPIQTMYELVSAVTCRARGGNDGWEGAMYFVVT